MNSDPLSIALRELTETKHLVEDLLTSSESFNYFKAKAALDQLRLKVKVLGRIQAEYMEEQADLPEQIIPFPRAGLRFD